ncbi:MAG: hypothetical protein ACUVT9_05435 [Candidatus Bathycorpusculaceae bacterium]
MSESLKQKAKFGKDIFKTLADAFRTNYDLWNTLEFEEWVRLEDAEAELKRQTDTELERQDLAYQELVAKAERDCYKCIEEQKQKLDFLIKVMKRWLKVYEDCKKESWYRDIEGLIPKFEELLEK